MCAMISIYFEVYACFALLVALLHVPQQRRRTVGDFWLDLVSARAVV